MIWAITDTGVDYQHPDLNTRIVGGHDYPGCTPVAGEPGNDCGGGHGTHVSGIVGGDATAGFADGQGFKYGFGIAPGVSFFAQNSVDNGGPWPPAGGWQEHSKWAILGGAVGGNQSWTTGEGTAHGYQASERTHDIMVRDGNFDTPAVAEPYIQVFSAGNSGPGAQTLTSPKEAKNIITVASSDNYRVGSIDTISSFSSRGPAVDGRVKPDITAPGNQIASTRNDTGGSCASAIAGTNNMYAFCSGTSMAAPHVSGSVALVTEWWRSFNVGVTESPAMAKALLVNGTVDMGGADRPNFNEGWGRVHLTNVVDSGALSVYKDQELVFDNTGESQVIAIGVPDPTRPLRVTLVWSDAPGAVGANPALVNNLDLTVETNGNTYKGNVFSGGWSTTGGTADIRNNVENVFVQSPGGDAVITISATAIVGDGVYYSGDTTDQSFALVCSNCAEQADFTLNVSPSSLGACAPADGTFTVDIGQILSFSDPVTLAAAGNPAGTTVGFSTNPVIPPGSSTLTISGTGGATAGSYPIQVDGTSTTGTKTRNVTFNLFTTTPGAVTLVAPADGALNQPARPTFEWTAADQGDTYLLEVATDAAFTNLVLQQGVAGTSFEPASDLPTNTQYWWRVSAQNICGPGGFSSVFTFTTEALPGDCGLGTQASTEYFDDLETGAPGWVLGSGGSGQHLGPVDRQVLQRRLLVPRGRPLHRQRPAAGHPGGDPARGQQPAHPPVLELAADGGPHRRLLRRRRGGDLHQRRLDLDPAAERGHAHRPVRWAGYRAQQPRRLVRRPRRGGNGVEEGGGGHRRLRRPDRATSASAWAPTRRSAARAGTSTTSRSSPASFNDPPMFGDDFETGTTDAWSYTMP